MVFGQTRQDATAAEFEEEYQSDTSVYENENQEQSDIGEDETYEEETMEETQSDMEEMEQETESEFDEAADEVESEYEEAEQEVESEYDQAEDAIEQHEEEMHQTETETESEIDRMETGTESEMDRQENETETGMDQSSEQADMNRDDAEQASVRIEADEKLNNDFSEYKTYNFVSHVDEELDPGFYFLNDLEFKANVRETVKGELEGLGYRRDENDPDLLISFRVFDEPVTLKGFTDPGYGDGYWGTDMQVREWGDTTSYDVEAGTLLLSVLDAEQGEIVWQGFASGLLDQDAFSKDEQKIAEAVELLFEEYGHRGDDLEDQVVK